jgi:hypothetical protein
VPEEQVPVSSIKVDQDLTYFERPMEILDTKDRVTRNKVVRQYKILWSNHGENDATWETEEYLRRVYPHFYQQRLVYLISG